MPLAGAGVSHVHLIYNDLDMKRAHATRVRQQKGEYLCSNT